MLDDDKNLDKNLTKIMVGGALLTNALVFAVAYDVGYQSASKQAQPTIIFGNQTINNSKNFNSSDGGSISK